MAEEQTAPTAAEPVVSSGMTSAFQALGPYTTLQEAVSRLSRVPIGLILDEDNQPVTVVLRETLQALLGGGKDAARAHGKMGARQQAREKREGISNTSSLISLREDLPPLVTAEVGADLAGVAAAAQAGHADGVLVLDQGKRAGVLLTRALLRRMGAVHPAAPAEPHTSTT